ncbi:hypothetical protein H8E65_10670 [Candidatus Bathyarchaeota archaeon]|nr:hypothetical protein [Candidatus Bathyarchaeota archaeon]
MESHQSYALENREPRTAGLGFSALPAAKHQIQHPEAPIQRSTSSTTPGNQL